MLAEIYDVTAVTYAVFRIMYVLTSHEVAPQAVDAGPLHNKD